MSRSFSVEDLLDEVEKICYDASGNTKVRLCSQFFIMGEMFEKYKRRCWIFHKHAWSVFT